MDEFIELKIFLDALNESTIDGLSLLNARGPLCLGVCRIVAGMSLWNLRTILEKNIRSLPQYYCFLDGSRKLIIPYAQEQCVRAVVCAGEASSLFIRAETAEDFLNKISGLSSDVVASLQLNIPHSLGETFGPQQGGIKQRVLLLECERCVGSSALKLAVFRESGPAELNFEPVLCIRAYEKVCDCFYSAALRSEAFTRTVYFSYFPAPECSSLPPTVRQFDGVSTSLPPYPLYYLPPPARLRVHTCARLRPARARLLHADAQLPEARAVLPGPLRGAARRGAPRRRVHNSCCCCCGGGVGVGGRGR
jgi:hypothetical protein